MSWVVVGVGAAAVVGGAISYIGSENQASAIGAAGNAQLTQQQADRQAAYQAANNPNYLAEIQNTINLNNQDIARKDAILATTDPAIIEAGKQAQQLLAGQSSAALKPIQDQRAQQRSVLQQQLQKQLGPGYATSSAGITALNQFDTQTSNMLAGAQQQTLASLLGVSQNFSAAGLTSNINTQANIASQYGNQAAMEISAINGTPINQANAYAGQVAQGNAAIGFGKNIAGIGSSLASMYGNKGNTVYNNSISSQSKTTAGADTPNPTAQNTAYYSADPSSYELA